MIKFLAYLTMVVSIFQFCVGLLNFLEAARTQSSHKCYIGFGTAMAFIFAGRILSWW